LNDVTFTRTGLVVNVVALEQTGLQQTPISPVELDLVVREDAAGWPVTSSRMTTMTNQTGVKDERSCQRKWWKTKTTRWETHIQIGNKTIACHNSSTIRSNR